MAKTKRAAAVFFCKACGNEFARWEGKCPACGEWDALVEAPHESVRPRKGGAAAEPVRSVRTALQAGPKPLRSFAGERLTRLDVPLVEFNRALGGGAVPGGSVLLGGEPGIGKSTLLLQVLGAMAGAKTLYPDLGRKAGPPLRPLLFISGEEAPSQIAERGLRLGQFAREFGLLKR